MPPRFGGVSSQAVRLLVGRVLFFRNFMRWASMVQRQLFSRRALPYYVLGLAALTVVHELVEVTPRANHVFAPAARPRRLSRPLARKKENGEPPAAKSKLLRGTDEEWDELVDRGSYVFPEGKQLRELPGNPAAATSKVSVVAQKNFG